MDNTPTLKDTIKDVDAIIFDLGGVILDLDYTKTIQALSLLAGFDVSSGYAKNGQHEFFSQFEAGQISAATFRDQLRTLLKTEVSDPDLDAAWGALILGYPAQRLALIRQLRQRKPVFLLSNNNEIHLERCNQLFTDTFGPEFGSLSDQFDCAYYSHLVKDRKPNPTIFHHVLKDQGLDPSRTLFLEDIAHNVAAARAVGLQTIHIDNQVKLETIDWSPFLLSDRQDSHP